MGKLGKFSAKGLKDLQKNMEKLTQQDRDAFVAGCAKEIAARLLGKTVKRTPVGVYPKSTGKHGGTLRRGWTVQEIRKEGNVYIVDIVNTEEHTSYVEFGHRTRDHMGWVQGRFMLTISEQEVTKLAPKLLETRLEQYLRGIME